MTKSLPRRILLGVLMMTAILTVLLVLAGRGPVYWYTMAEFATSGRSIEFYGRVIDQTGAPIQGAAVTITIESFDFSTVFSKEDQHTKARSINRTTRSDGTFEVVGENGTRLNITNVSKEGYVPIPERDWTYKLYYKDISFDYSPTQGNFLYVPDAKRPAILPLRKVGEPRRLAPSKGGTERLIP
jgi:hypothetical protein